MIDGDHREAAKPGDSSIQARGPPATANRRDQYAQEERPCRVLSTRRGQYRCAVEYPSGASRPCLLCYRDTTARIDRAIAQGHLAAGVRRCIIADLSLSLSTIRYSVTYGFSVVPAARLLAADARIPGPRGRCAARRRRRLWSRFAD